MKKNSLLPMLILIFILCVCSQVHCAATDRDKRGSIMEERIWKLEETHFTNLYDADNAALTQYITHTSCSGAVISHG